MLSIVVSCLWKNYVYYKKTDCIFLNRKEITIDAPPVFLLYALRFLLKKVKRIRLCKAGHFQFIDTHMSRQGGRKVNHIGNVFCM